VAWDGPSRDFSSSSLAEPRAAEKDQLLTQAREGDAAPAEGRTDGALAQLYSERYGWKFSLWLEILPVPVQNPIPRSPSRNTFLTPYPGIFYSHVLFSAFIFSFLHRYFYLFRIFHTSPNWHLRISHHSGTGRWG
jgi:hypothetical protein